MSRRSVWQRRVWLWAPALAFLVLNLALYGFYRMNFAGESAGMERRLADREETLAELRGERSERELLLERAAANRELVDRLYRDRFATRSQRLTQVMAEVSSLAEKAGLDPQAISLPEERIEEFGLVERSFVFSVQGSYEQLRRFINFLELSPSFLTLKQVSLTGSDGRGAGLQISLALSTLFLDTADGEPDGESEAVS